MLGVAILEIILITNVEADDKDLFLRCRGGYERLEEAELQRLHIEAG